MERDELKGKQTPGSNIRWEQCYEIQGMHWALVSDDEKHRVLNLYTVLFCSEEQDLEGNPINDQPDLALYAEAHNVANRTGLWPEDMVERIKELEYGLTAMSKVARKLAGWSGHDIEELNDQYDGVFDNADRLLYSK